MDIFDGRLRGLDLFSGIGGISIALDEWVRTVAYCEREPYCQAVLLSRMASKDIDNAPIWDDVTTLRGSELPPIDIIFGGFPCQDISVAGAGKGLEGERSGLFFEIMRLAQEIKPKLLFLENVAAVTSRGGLRVVREVASLGYDCRWCIISASSVGALHRRERWFLLAYAKHDGAFASEAGGGFGECLASREESGQSQKGFGEAERASGLSSDVAHSKREGLEEHKREARKQEESEFGIGGFCHSDSLSSEQANSCAESNASTRELRRGLAGQYWPFESRDDWQEVVSTIRRVDDGVANRVDRLKCLGNSVVPIQVKEAFKILMGLQ